MFCSITTDKSTSNWLDRLRSSKGFPVENSLDLEHFLNPNPNPNPNLPYSSDTKTPEEDNRPDSNSDSAQTDENFGLNRATISEIREKKEDWFDVMSSVLAELFNSGDPREFRRIRAFDDRKSSRKQSNPKICILSASASVDDSAQRADGVPAMSPSSADNSVAEVKELDDRIKTRKHGIQLVNPEEESSKIDSDLSAFSRAEVTIIDTSSPMWKSEKLIFRKGNVWKIRDKKWNSGNVSSCRKKRKLGQSDRLGGEKVKLQSSCLPMNAFNEAGPKEHLMSANEGRTHSNKKATPRETPDDLEQVPEKRPHFSRTPRKPAAKDSSVFHIQCIPTNKKVGAYCPKSCLKKKK
ncbi:fantom protein isoform X2 [Tasmannia lanceolata]|uniref:fantom protein isoform X2 n=1 Tax=Tasmannia lanceolata TaxID=3420 RepID=UPI004064820C